MANKDALLASITKQRVAAPLIGSSAGSFSRQAAGNRAYYQPTPLTK